MFQDIFQVVIDFMQKNNLLTRYSEEKTREKFENTVTDTSYENYEKYERLHFYMDELCMAQRTKKYVDGKLAGKTMKPDRKLIIHTLGVVIEFMQKNNLLSRYSKKNTKRQYKQDNNFGEVPSSGPTARQLQLVARYKEYEERRRLDFYIEEFAPQKSLWDEYSKDVRAMWNKYSQRLSVRTMWDKYSQRLSVRTLWDKFSQSRNIPALWNVISWYKLRNKNRIIWQLAWGGSSMDTKRKMMKMRDKYLQEAETSNFAKTANFADSITAELHLTFDIFNQWRVNDDTLDKFISKNLPPKERFSFVTEMSGLKKLPPSFDVLARIKYIRSAYKKIVFDKEIVKRAVILQLKQRNERIREAWDEEVMNGNRIWGLSKLQTIMQREYNDYKENGLMDRFPYDREWIVFKYRNIHKWLAVNARVFVLCKLH